MIKLTLRRSDLAAWDVPIDLDLHDICCKQNNFAYQIKRIHFSNIHVLVILFNLNVTTIENRIFIVDSRVIHIEPFSNDLLIECLPRQTSWAIIRYLKSVSYTHLRAHETRGNLVCRLLLEKKNDFFRCCWLLTTVICIAETFILLFPPIWQFSQGSHKMYFY